MLGERRIRAERAEGAGGLGHGWRLWLGWDVGGVVLSQWELQSFLQGRQVGKLWQ